MNRQNNVGGRIQPSRPPMMNSRGRGPPPVGRGGPLFPQGGRALIGRYPNGGRGHPIGRMPGRGPPSVAFPGDRQSSTSIGFTPGPRVISMVHTHQGVRPGLPLQPQPQPPSHGTAVLPPPPPPPPPRHPAITNARGRGGAPLFAHVNARGPSLMVKETNRHSTTGRESISYQHLGTQAQPFPQINHQTQSMRNGVIPAPPPPPMNYLQPPNFILNQAVPRPSTFTPLTTAGTPSDPRQQYSRDATPTNFSTLAIGTDPRTAPTAPTTASQLALAPGNAVQPVHNLTATQEQIDQAWIEYTPPNGGTKYYYNSITRSSQYEKPPTLKAKESVCLLEKVSDSSVWKEYVDPNTGKKYYSDGKSTTWDRPACMEGADERKAEEESQGPPRKKKKTVKHDIEFSNKEEAIAAFKGLLLAKEILPSMKWNDVVKLCSADPRWDACEESLTTGERKQAMAEYQTKRANELKTIEREEKVRAKEAFQQMLSTVLPSLPNFSCWTSRFGDIRDLLAKDDRFHAVATEGERESLFLDFCEDFKKREERRKRDKKNETKTAFLAFLEEKEEQGILTFASTWKSFLSALTDVEKSDSRFVTSKMMNDSDRQLYFADYVIELQAAEDDKRNRIRGARRRAEKAQREAFEDALYQLARDGKILPSSTWRSVEDLVTSLPSYGPVHDQDREAPREMFENFVDDWSESYRRDRMVLSQIYSSAMKNQFVVTPDTNYEEFTKALLEAAAETSDLHAHARRIINRSEPVSSARMYLKELILEAKGISGAVIARAIRRRSGHDSSEDEGEIVEEDTIALV